MSVYETLIEKGYYKGNLAELNPDMDLINEISKKLYSYLENKKQHFYFFLSLFSISDLYYGMYF